MKYVLIITIQLFSLAFAQKTDTIRTYKNRYYTGTQKFTYSGLKSTLMSYPSSAVEYKLYDKNTLPGTLFGLGALGLDVVALTKIDDNKFLPYFISGLALGTVEMMFMHYAKKHLNKAVLLYNRNTK